jgi:TatD DNase family protein
LLHLVLEVSKTRVLIGNNVGGVNGWAPLSHVLGRAVTVPLVDIGVNLAHRSFDADREEVIARAGAAGVTLVITGTDLPASRRAAYLAETHGLYATAGIHPHHAKDFEPSDVDALGALDPVAIGECGLDFNRNFSGRAAQLECFEAQLELAAATHKPLFLHERDAFDEMKRLIERHRSRILRAVIHCFTGDAATLDAYLAMDLHIGITGWICDERRGKGLRELVKRIPKGRLMLETDAPFLAPPNRPRRNEPAFLPSVLDEVARARGEDVGETAAHTTRTAIDFFGLDD